MDGGNNLELPDCVLHPEQYHGEMQEVQKGFNSQFVLSQTPHMLEVYVSKL